VDHFDDHFLNDSPLGINFGEEPKFFDLEAAQEDFVISPALGRSETRGLRERLSPLMNDG